MTITFPGGKKVEAHFEGFTVLTDQPQEGGGEGSAPAPMDLFLTSIGTCTGFYALSFCQKHGIPTEDITLQMNVKRDENTHLATNIIIDILVPLEFPEKYQKAVIKAAETCTVKKHLEHPPKITISCRKP